MFPLSSSSVKRYLVKPPLPTRVKLGDGGICHLPLFGAVNAKDHFGTLGWIGPGGNPSQFIQKRHGCHLERGGLEERDRPRSDPVESVLAGIHTG